MIHDRVPETNAENVMITPPFGTEANRQATLKGRCTTCCAGIVLRPDDQGTCIEIRCRIPAPLLAVVYPPNAALGPGGREKLPRLARHAHHIAGRHHARMVARPRASRSLAISPGSVRRRTAASPAPGTPQAGSRRRRSAKRTILHAADSGLVTAGPSSHRRPRPDILS